ncbi:hypothetical protein DPMN_024916 [Dreissena polymorpha]|uniref:Uncharacterized protein n=1 Tax=Dreissena polymorpha TaxID=45954 RepID=A0A9D4LQP0_DREPO|nr:hypothetical protein DPMN_024916 [Dreissena polymorpha]
MPHAGGKFLKVGEVVEKLMLVLQVFRNDDCAVDDLFHSAPPCFKSSLLLRNQFFGFNFQAIVMDAYYDFAEIPDMDYGKVILE